MYAIIRTGGKQAKVHEGDVLDVERLRVDDEVSFTPLLVVDDEGTVFSGRDELKTARVVARIVGGSAGPKLDIFKYKNKTGYRRRMGHRQKYTTIEVTAIQAPSATTAAPKKAAAPADEPEAKAPEAKEPAAKKPAAKKPAAAKAAASTAKKPAATAKGAATSGKAAAKKASTKTGSSAAADETKED